MPAFFRRDRRQTFAAATSLSSDPLYSHMFDAEELQWAVMASRGFWLTAGRFTKPACESQRLINAAGQLHDVRDLVPSSSSDLDLSPGIRVVASPRRNTVKASVIGPCWD